MTWQECQIRVDVRGLDHNDTNPTRYKIIVHDTVWTTFSLTITPERKLLWNLSAALVRAFSGRRPPNRDFHTTSSTAQLYSNNPFRFTRFPSFPAAVDFPGTVRRRKDSPRRTGAGGRYLVVPTFSPRHLRPYRLSGSRRVSLSRKNNRQATIAPPAAASTPPPRNLYVTINTRTCALFSVYFTHTHAHLCI